MHHHHKEKIKSLLKSTLLTVLLFAGPLALYKNNTITTRGTITTNVQEDNSSSSFGKHVGHSSHTRSSPGNNPNDPNQNEVRHLAKTTKTTTAIKEKDGTSNHLKEQETDLQMETDHTTKFPSIYDTIELSHLSNLVYYFDEPHHNCTNFLSIIKKYSNRHPDSFVFHNDTDDDNGDDNGGDGGYTAGSYTCHFYERDEQDTQVLIISKRTETIQNNNGNDADKNDHEDQVHDYIAIAYAGTDDFRNALTDTNIFTKRFGPPGPNNTYPLAPQKGSEYESARVHAGFDNAVFDGGLMDRIIDVVEKVMKTTADENDGSSDGKELKLFTTGHSLGAADAVLTSVALSKHFPDKHISCINYGCPKTGNRVWRDYVNSISNISIYRVVNRYDIVPRLPDIRFVHAGHTLQLDTKYARAYYLHEGDKTMELRGVPFGWNAYSYALAPAAAMDHIIGRYLKYLGQKSLVDEDRYYFDEFEHYRGGGDDRTEEDDEGDEGNDDEYYVPPSSELIEFEMELSDERKREIGRESAELYMKFLREEKEGGEASIIVGEAQNDWSREAEEVAKSW
jgi:hypothetical protein